VVYHIKIDIHVVVDGNMCKNFKFDFSYIPVR